MDLIVHRPQQRLPNQLIQNSIALETQVLCTNLENHIGNKVKLSFIPNQYYNEKIYTLIDYTIYHDKTGINISMKLKENDIVVEFKLDEILKVESSEYFNRIEYKAFKSLSDVYREVYNFCLYF
ncbi:MAG: hypothetical protein ACM3KR_06500 [Deltaproteobacteria bacterium]